nr:MAG TPA: hypothetical protein [Caudoviricetes sp.]DAT31397.1 MAG TPA: hypothetical protein [Caudoviricetes sp.]
MHGYSSCPNYNLHTEFFQELIKLFFYCLGGG